MPLKRPQGIFREECLWWRGYCDCVQRFSPCCSDVEIFCDLNVATVSAHEVVGSTSAGTVTIKAALNEVNRTAVLTAQ